IAALKALSRGRPVRISISWRNLSSSIVFPRLVALEANLIGSISHAAGAAIARWCLARLDVAFGDRPRRSMYPVAALVAQRTGPRYLASWLMSCDRIRTCRKQGQTARK